MRGKQARHLALARIKEEQHCGASCRSVGLTAMTGVVHICRSCAKQDRLWTSLMEEEYEGKEDQGTSEELANESHGQSFARGMVTWMSKANRHHKMNKDAAP